MDVSTVETNDSLKINKPKTQSKKKSRKRKVEDDGKLIREEMNETEQQQQQSSDTVYSCITLDEKKKLLNVIKTKGFGIIYTPQLLLDEFPGRSKNEIAFMIENYKRKGKEFVNKLKTSVNIDVNEKSGTEPWYTLVHNLVPHLSKRDDMSDLLIDLFNDYSDECKKDRPDGRGNYDQIYGYLADVLGGKYPRDLNAFDSLILISLLEKLSEYSETVDVKDEEEFMESGSWWNKKDDKSIEENQDEQGINTSTGSDVIKKYFESCLEYPKIRKIRHCLNPLNVPVKMLQDEHEKVSKLLQSHNPS